MTSSRRPEEEEANRRSRDRLRFPTSSTGRASTASSARRRRPRPFPFCRHSTGSSSCKSIFLPTVVAVVLVVISVVDCSGRFQLRVVNYRNIRGDRLADGRCCIEAAATTTATTTTTTADSGRHQRLYRQCPMSTGGGCSVVYWACLRELQVRISAESAESCTFGNRSTTPRDTGTMSPSALTSVGVGDVSSSSSKDETDPSSSSIDLSFDFAWTVCFKLLLTIR